MQLNNKYKNINQLIFEMTTSKDKNLSRDKAILLANEILLLLEQMRKVYWCRECL